MNDPLFNHFTATEWRYYSVQLALDEEEEFEKQRGLIEYLAMFSNPDGVRRVRTQRAQREVEESLNGDNKPENSFDDEQFARFIGKDKEDLPKFRPRV